MNEIKLNESMFESIKHIDENGVEYWYARELQKVLEVGNNAKMTIQDYKLSRYACYLIVQNGDSRKEVIALGQTYFEIQTRKLV